MFRCNTPSSIFPALVATLPPPLLLQRLPSASHFLFATLLPSVSHFLAATLLPSPLMFSLQHPLPALVATFLPSASYVLVATPRPPYFFCSRCNIPFFSLAFSCCNAPSFASHVLVATLPPPYFSALVARLLSFFSLSSSHCNTPGPLMQTPSFSLLCFRCKIPSSWLFHSCCSTPFFSLFPFCCNELFIIGRIVLPSHSAFFLILSKKSLN